MQLAVISGASVKETVNARHRRAPGRDQLAAGCSPRINASSWRDCRPGQMKSTAASLSVSSRDQPGDFSSTSSTLADASHPGRVRTSEKSHDRSGSTIGPYRPGPIPSGGVLDGTPRHVTTVPTASLTAEAQPDSGRDENGRDHAAHPFVAYRRPGKDFGKLTAAVSTRPGGHHSPDGKRSSTFGASILHAEKSDDQQRDGGPFVDRPTFHHRQVHGPRWEPPVASSATDPSHPHPPGRSSTPSCRRPTTVPHPMR